MQRVELHGHRGARWLAPENTIPGFVRALGIGVDALELDVGMTADGVVVVTHDPQPNPSITRDERGIWLDRPGPSFASLSLNELRRFDVGRIRPGTAYAASFPEQVPHDGAGIPTLAEVFCLDPVVRFNIELKTFPDRPGLAVPGPVLAEAVVACSREAGVAGRIIVQSFDWSGLRHLQTAHPDIPLAWLTDAGMPEAAPWWGFSGPVADTIPKAVAAAGGLTWAPAYRRLTLSLLEEARMLGLRVVPWTVNDAADMARLIAWGVDGIITDRPDLVREALAGMIA